MHSGASQYSQAKPEVPLHELLDSPYVEIYVGEERTRWCLPEKLLSHHSPVLAEAFGNNPDQENTEPSRENDEGGKKSFELTDEENATFKLLIAYLYSQTLAPPTSEQAVGPLLDLYLLALRLQVDSLTIAVVDAVREWYHQSSTYPGLRRVQYIYANTDEDNEMREMMVSSIARQLTTSESIPAHWAVALQRNGQLAVDIIRVIQQWHLEEKSVPDVRNETIGRDRKMKGGFSAVERQEDSVETDTSAMADSAIGMESHDGDAEEFTKGKTSGEQDETREKSSIEA